MAFIFGTWWLLIFFLVFGHYSVFGVVVITLLMASFSWFVIEKPALELKKSSIRN